MRADLTRLTFDPRKHFSRVLSQQGRVQLDADFNEQVAILLHYLRALSIDLMGEHWGVGDGFSIEPGDPFTIHPGHYYVNGILCENDSLVNYTAQPYYPNPEGLTKGQNYEVYLDVWERDISSIEEPSILEVALGGPDTAARTKVVWQVKVDTDETRSRIELSDARLQARALSPVKTDDPCIIPPDARYRGPENQLYRVEIHRGTPDPTFKWSRENGSVVFPIRKRDERILTLEHLGRDERFGLDIGDWVEIVDDDHALQGRSEPLLRVDAIDPLTRRVTLHNSPVAPGADDERKHPLLRRWDQKPASRAQADDGALSLREDRWVDLEDGIQIKFKSEGPYRSGDYWMIPARTATGDVEWPGPSNSPEWVGPHGVTHSFATLARLSIDEKGTRTVRDLRRLSEHHREHEFTIPPGSTAPFALPKTLGPVRIEVSFGLEPNGPPGTQIPSEVMAAVVNRDPVSHQITWIGTNNDGTQQAGTSLATHPPVIARIFGGAPPLENATLEVEDPVRSRLRLSQSRQHTERPGYYVVRLWF